MTPTCPTDALACSERGDRGLTLLELLVVISVMALIAVSLPGLIARPAAHGDTVREMMAELRSARSEAVFAGVPVDMIVDLNRQRFGAMDAVHQLSAGTEVTITSARAFSRSGSVQAIRFFPDGSASGGRVVLKTGAQSDVIEIGWLTGRITLGN